MTKYHFTEEELDQMVVDSLARRRARLQPQEQSADLNRNVQAAYDRRVNGQQAPPPEVAR